MSLYSRARCNAKHRDSEYKTLNLVEIRRFGRNLHLAENALRRESTQGFEDGFVPAHRSIASTQCGPRLLHRH